MLKVKELREKSITDLNIEISRLKREQMNLRFQKVYGKLESVNRVNLIRKAIARIKTVIREKRS